MLAITVLARPLLSPQHGTRSNCDHRLPDARVGADGQTGHQLLRVASGCC